ncbi:MSHA biogenesis protein MshP [Desulfuromusa kysingii]|uniref:MSHA biogenesis protein MshP n=1 Tax=Desulfuromusa kysingii TaxID=37625 RepID=A0A1H3WSC9_9BACT|nr:pilus assembly protein MshP [Desulfuromusa kysingii]SDZ90066.1 MSHA biogenesis protein MshP [Desulfuromusa kysingii]
MKNLSFSKKQSGFTLVQAIFILVVLSLLGLVMVRMIGVQSSTSVFALQGARAYQAARSGLEWGAARAKAGESCNGTLDLDSFNVNVLCSSQPFTEGSIGPYDVYHINATATFGSYGSPDFISRRVQMKVGFP